MAARHGASVSNVASAWVLSHGAVRATLIGARLGEAQHRDDNLRALQLTLSGADLARIGEAASRVWSGDAGKVLAHATSGPALQQNLVCVMEG